jgi:hypothetical protein
MRRVRATMLLGTSLLIATVVLAVGVGTVAGQAELFDVGFFVFLFAGLWLYWGLGTLIVIRADGHIVGWLFAVAAVLMGWVFGCYGIGGLLGASQPADPLAAWFGLVGALLFPIALILILPAVALTFPTGALPGPRWRWPVGLVVSMVGVRVLAIVSRPGPMGVGGPNNPLTPWLPDVSPSGLAVMNALDAIGSLSIVLGAGLGVAAIIVRFRRSHGDERLQLKWFLAAMTPAAVLLPASLSELGTIFPIINVLSVAALPIAGISVAVAILRYRLYDIDRIISRTIAYGLVTAIVALVFGAVVLFLSTALSSFAQGQTIAVAVSTLVGFAVFQPVLRHVRRGVDMRFNRTRYDAERTVAEFSARLRDEVDLAALGGDLDTTIRDAISPRSLGIWLRESKR